MSILPSKARYVSPKKQLLLSLFLYLAMILVFVMIGMLSNNIFYGNIFIALGAIPFGVSLFWVYSVLKTRSWIKQSGTVISSKVVSENIPLQIDFMSVRRYTPVIDYKYYVGEKMFFSSTFSPLHNDFRFDMEQDAKAVINNFSVGEDIDICVNPKELSKSIVVKVVVMKRVYKLQATWLLQHCCLE